MISSVTLNGPIMVAIGSVIIAIGTVFLMFFVAPLELDEVLHSKLRRNKIIDGVIYTIGLVIFSIGSIIWIFS